MANSMSDLCWSKMPDEHVHCGKTQSTSSPTQSNYCARHLKTTGSIIRFLANKFGDLFHLNRLSHIRSGHFAKPALRGLCSDLAAAVPGAAAGSWLC